MTGGAGLSGGGGGEAFGWDVDLEVSASGGLADDDGTCGLGAIMEAGGGPGFQGTIGMAAGAGLGEGLSWSGPFFAPGAISIGLLAGVALGGIHSERPWVVNAPGCSPPIAFVSDGRSLRRDWRSLLNELSSSPCGGADQLLGA